jgi:hypothetical protein
MYHEVLRRRLSYSADQRRRREERASSWLLVLGSVWLAFGVLLMCPLPPLTLSLILSSPFSVIFGMLLALGCIIGERFK